MIILLTAVLAGLLDGLAASLYFRIRGNRNPADLFRFIASAAFGPRALKGGGRMAAWGLFFHFMIAGVFIVLYFLAYPLVPGMGAHPLAAGAIYGLLVWIVMNRVVLPLSKAPKRKVTISFILINILILVLTIGWPAALAARYCAMRT